VRARSSLPRTRSVGSRARRRRGHASAARRRAPPHRDVGPPFRGWSPPRRGRAGGPHGPRRPRRRRMRSRRGRVPSSRDRVLTREARRPARLERAISPPRGLISRPRIPPSFRHLAPNSGRTPDANLRISPARVRLTSGDSSGQFATSAGVRNGRESRGPLLARRLEARTRTRNERRSS
jgi:hypothetical protein